MNGPESIGLDKIDETDGSPYQQHFDKKMGKREPQAILQSELGKNEARKAAGADGVIGQGGPTAITREEYERGVEVPGYRANQPLGADPELQPYKDRDGVMFYPGKNEVLHGDN